MMPRRLVTILALAILSATATAAAQDGGKKPRIGFLMGGRGGTAGGQYLHEAFQQGLREQGWFEGQNIGIEWRSSLGKNETLPSLAAELVRLKVDVIVAAGGDPAIRAAMEATRTIPIVMPVSSDPVASGLVADLARPGGNVTGLSIFATATAGKRLELLKEVVPSASRVAVIWNAASAGKEIEWKETQRAAQSLGLTVLSAPVRGPKDFDAAFAAIVKARPQILVAFSEPLVLAHRRQIADFATRNRLPAISEVREFAEAGGLMTYGASLADLFRRAAGYVDKILKGAKPASLPVEQPTRFEMVINLRTAKALGLTLPPSILLRADHVIE